MTKKRITKSSTKAKAPKRMTARQLKAGGFTNGLWRLEERSKTSRELMERAAESYAARVSLAKEVANSAFPTAPQLEPSRALLPESKF